VILPPQVQESLPPLRGYYRIKCVTPNNQASFTKNINWNDSWHTVQHRINNDCFQMNEKVSVTDLTNKFRYKDNGIHMQIRFKGTNQDPGQYEIVPPADTSVTHLAGDTA
jgi:hypothetical protein